MPIALNHDIKPGDLLETPSGVRLITKVSHTPDGDVCVKHQALTGPLRPIVECWSSGTHMRVPDADQTERAAYRCGRDLDPEDPRSEWVGTHPHRKEWRLVEGYHEGQAERYEQEDW